MAIMAAMKKVLSPISDTRIMPHDLRKPLGRGEKKKKERKGERRNSFGERGRSSASCALRTSSFLLAHLSSSLHGAHGGRRAGRGGGVPGRGVWGKSEECQRALKYRSETRRHSFSRVYWALRGGVGWKGGGGLGTYVGRAPVGGRDGSVNRTCSEMKSASFTPAFFHTSEEQLFRTTPLNSPTMGYVKVVKSSPYYSRYQVRQDGGGRGGRGGRARGGEGQSTRRDGAGQCREERVAPAAAPHLCSIPRATW